MNILGDHIETSLGYWTSHLSQQSAQRVAGTLSHILKSLLQGLDKVVGKLDLLSDVDKGQMQSWNTPYPAASRCVQDDFVSYAAENPESLAVSSWDGDLTYRALDILSDRLANYLHKLQISQDDIVPLCFEKSKWTIVAMLGVLKAGGACAMLSPEHPQSRTDQILDMIHARILLVSPLHSSISKRVQQLITVDQKLLNDIADCEERPQTNRPEPTSSAFIVFTSGSTGTPKAIVLEHAGVCTSSDVHGKAFGIGPGSRVLRHGADATR